MHWNAVTRHLLSLLISTIALTACGSVPSKPARLARSSLGCIEAVVQRVDIGGLNDQRVHCLVAGSISRYCSISEAYLAGIGKEIVDLFTRGDAQWTDWRADRIGIACAREAHDDAELAVCCEREERIR